jgi:hypothetical protein
MTTSSRMYCEFLRLLFLQAHRETTAQFHATGLVSQQTRSDNEFWFKLIAFYMGLKSKVGLVSAKALTLRINLNIQGCIEVAPSPHAPSHASLLIPLLLSHDIPLPRIHQCVMDRLVQTGLCSSSLVAHVLHLSPPPHANSFVIGTEVINLHTHTHTHTPWGFLFLRHQMGFTH